MGFAEHHDVIRAFATLSVADKAATIGLVKRFIRPAKSLIGQYNEVRTHPSLNKETPHSGERSEPAMS